ncbi:MAG: SDR family oxidoreductase [Victivallales bacterium]|nr:SDR family oxidoreductase [Victivallales bacterium]MCF7888975.1 SDR family oxidoreductase [Victivallales bacterium]
MPFKIDLSDKTAVVTGGGGVLCSVLARALAACGAKTAILDIKKEAADKTAEMIRADGGTAIGVQCNVLQKENIIKAEKIISEKLGKCDILINGAGGNHAKGTTTKEYLYKEDIKDNPDITTFFDLDPESINFIFKFNFLGTLLPSQIFSKPMAEKSCGTIVNVSSMNAFCPLTKIPAYSGAKAAVSNFTQWLAVHLSKIGIRVNAIAPGFFITDQNRSLLINKDSSLTERGNKIISQTPMGRFGAPEDLIGTLLWLIDNRAAGFVNGIVVPVDGAFSSYSGV